MQTQLSPAYRLAKVSDFHSVRVTYLQEENVSWSLSFLLSRYKYHTVKLFSRIKTVDKSQTRVSMFLLSSWIHPSTPFILTLSWVGQRILLQSNPIITGRRQGSPLTGPALPIKAMSGRLWFLLWFQGSV